MADPQIPLRNQIPDQFKWNAPSVFESEDDWEESFKNLSERLSGLNEYRGRLGQAPDVLADAMDLAQSLMQQGGQIMVYAMLAHSVDVADPSAAKMFGRAQSLHGQLAAAISFIQPELLAIGRETLDRWMDEEPRLSVLAHYVDDLFRKQAHIRSAEVEELLGGLADPFSGTSVAASVLTNADFKFAPAVSSDGTKQPVSQGTFGKILAGADREARRTAWEHYADTYLAFKHTLTSTLATSIKQNVFSMRARRHESTLQASLFENNVPVKVFETLIATFRQNLGIWHRYWAIRRKALGVEQLHPYDIWAPLTQNRPTIPYKQAVDWICEGLAPMGQEYVDIVRRGCLQDRWVDVYPNRGKRAGAFSAGQPGTHPFIVMSYNDDILSLSTLAHELGHSMHSYLAWQNQPVLYGEYSLFVAEVASNFHQAMVRSHLLSEHPEPEFQIGVIEEAMSNFHRYFFIMPTLARFELEVHKRVERGQGLTADDMNELMADLFSEGYGDEVHVDRSRVGITWATFGHLYVDYYVYQYATGLSGAHVLSQRILSGAAGAVEDYLSFLKAGGSMYPLDALKLAGVDLTTPHVTQVTFGVLSDLVDRLETLIGA
jgi:oligoendopeptidase F